MIEVSDRDIHDLTLPSAFDEIVDGLLQGGGVHEPDFWWFKNMRAEDSLFIDIGANIGNSALSISNACPNATIHGFEPNSLLQPYLRRAAAYNPNFAFDLFGLADRAGEFELFVPIVDDAIIAGESSTELGHFEDGVVAARLRSYSADGRFSVVKLTCKFERLDDQGHLFDTAAQKIWKIIKIDTEGSELQVLKGGLAFIERFRPTIMIENGERPDICALLVGYGYSRYLYDEGSGALADACGRSALNSLFVYRPL